MARNHFSTLTLATTVSIALTGIAGATGISKPLVAMTTTKSGMVQPAALTATKLGDLTPFRAIAADTLGIATKGDLSAAATRAKDLEALWDDHAHAMRAMDKAGWTAIDKALDATFQQLRAAKPDAVGCVAALTNLLKVMDATS